MTGHILRDGDAIGPVSRSGDAYGCILPHGQIAENDTKERRGKFYPRLGAKGGGQVSVRRRIGVFCCGLNSSAVARPTLARLTIRTLTFVRDDSVK